MNHPETVAIKVEPSKDNPEGVVIINKSDFVEGECTLFEEKPVAPAATQAVQTPAAATAQVSETPPVQPWNQPVA